MIYFQAALRRSVDLLEHSLEVGDAPIAGTQSRGIVERALEVLRDLAGTQGVAFAAGRRGRGSRGRAGATAGTRGWRSEG